MTRSLLCCGLLLGAADAALAGELDREVVPPAAPITPAAQSPAAAAFGTELDRDSPEPAHRYRGGWRYGGSYPGFGYGYPRGWGYGGFSVSYYRGGWGYGGFYPGFGYGYPAFGYRSYVSVGFGLPAYGYGGYCVW